MVQAHDEVSEAEDKELAFVEAIDGGEALALNGMIPGLSPGVELAPAVHRLPASVAAARSLAVTFAMFLCEPISHPKFSPICGESCGELWVKQSHTLFTLSYNFPLGLIKYCLEFW